MVDLWTERTPRLDLASSRRAELRAGDRLPIGRTSALSPRAQLYLCGAEAAERSYLAGTGTR